MTMRTAKGDMDINGYWSYDRGKNPTFWKTDHYVSDLLEAIYNAKRIIGLSAINAMAEEYNKNGEKSIIPQGGHAAGLWNSAEIAKTNKKEEVMYA